MIRAAALAWFALSVCAGACAAAGPSLAELLEQSKASFQPVTRADFEAAAEEVRASLTELLASIQQLENSQLAWRTYLNSDQQLARLEDDSLPTLDFWREVLVREETPAPGLDHDAFQRHRQAVRNLMAVIQSTHNERLEEEFKASLARLTDLIPHDDTTPSPTDCQEISRLMTTLASRRQATDLRSHLRTRYSRPNFLVSASKGFVESLVAKPIEQTFEVDELVRGASVCGEGLLKAEQQTNLLPNDARGAFAISVQGRTDSNTTAYRGRTSVDTQGTLKFKSVASLFVDARGIQSAPFATEGLLETNIVNVSSGLRGVRASRARKRVYDRQEDDRLAAQTNALNGVNSTFSAKLDEYVRDSNQHYVERIYRPLKCRDRFPSELKVRTSEESFSIQATLANEDQLAAPAPMSMDIGKGEILVATHQSAINNTVVGLGGRSLPLSSVLTDMFAWSGGERSRETTPLLVTLHPDRPLEISFNDDIVKITIAGTSYSTGGSKYSGMEIILQFRIVNEEGRPQLVSYAKPAVVLPQRPDGTRPRLGIRSLALRRILSNIINRDTPQKVELAELLLQDTLEHAPGLRLKSISARNGWLVATATNDSVADERSGAAPEFDRETP